MKLIRVSVFFLLAGLLIIGANATALAAPTQSWVADPATGCKIGWVHEASTLISARWSGPMVAGKAQGKGNLSLTVKGTDGKELQGQGEAEMIAGLLDGKVAIQWSNGVSYDGYYKAGLKEGKGIYKFADGRIYDGEFKAGRQEGKGIGKFPDGRMYEGEWKNDMPEGRGTFKWPNGNVYTGGYKNGVRDGHGVLKDAAGKIIYEGEYKDDKPVTQPAQPKTAPTLSWVADPATGCKIGWVHETSTLISARWSGPVVAGKAQGKGNLSLTIKGNDGKELQAQGQAEMLAGLLNGKVTLKWSDGSSYDGYYKAGLREGKGIYKFANGTIYDGEWKSDNGEGTGTYKFPDGSVYTGASKNTRPDGYGVFKDAAGKIIYEGEWKDGKTVTQSAQPKTAPTQSWVADTATGCKIGWVHEASTLISASWSGPMVAGKAQGKGNLSLIVKGTDGKEKQGQGVAEMLAGLLDGKAAIKWSSGDSYDGYYKAGLKEGKGIYKFADGRIYDGEWKNGKREGHGVLKDAAGKIIYEGEWKDDKPQPKR